MKWFFDMLMNERGEVGVKDDDKKTDDDDVKKDPDPALDEDHQDDDDDTTDDDAEGDLEIDLDADESTAFSHASRTSAAPRWTWTRSSSRAARKDSISELISDSIRALSSDSMLTSGGCVML